ncbi:MAG: GNAT family N-acetyltransferase [Candidatus Coproplasma sp.]
MEVIEYFSRKDGKEYLKQIEGCEWESAQFLAELLINDELQDLTGGWCKLFMLTEGERLVSFITFSARDDIFDTELTPWLGFFHTSPEFRGKGYGQQLLNYACNFAKQSGYDAVYVSTNLIGLYEKFGFTFQGIAEDFRGNPSRVYKKDL